MKESHNFSLKRDTLVSVLMGKKFKEKYGNKFYKFLSEDLIQYDFKYSLGLNVDTNKFNPTGECSKGGLYFSDINNILSFYKFGPNIGIIEIPDDSQVYIENNKFKANKIELKNILVNENEILKVLKYSHENGCRLNEDTCKNTATHGHLEVLKWLHENGCPWDLSTCFFRS